MGVSGCGKSTIGQHLAAQLGVSFIDGDDFHPPENIARMSQGIALNDADRMPWLQSINRFIVNEQTDATPSVIACSALKRLYRNVLSQSASILFVHLVGSYELIEARSQARTGHFFNMALLQSQFDTLEAPNGDEHFVTINIDASMSEVVQRCVNAVQSHALFRC